MDSQTYQNTHDTGQSYIHLSKGSTAADESEKQQSKQENTTA